jgi:hypothetical protein
MQRKLLAPNSSFRCETTGTRIGRVGYLGQRADAAPQRMERLGKPGHRRECERLSARTANESKSSALSAWFWVEAATTRPRAK